MNINKIVIYVTICSVVLIIGIPTLTKVIKENHRKLYLANEKLVTEKARACIYDGKCISKTVSLKELYTHGYLKEDLIDPVEKKVYSENSYVVVEKEDATFYPM